MIKQIKERELMPGINDTLQYYNKFSKRFFDTTTDIDFTDTQERFLKYFDSGSRILDYGCGAGRDTKYFLNRGYQVESIDGSKALVKLASEHTGIEVKQMLFQDLDAEGAYDGIWACASILHLSRAELADVFYRMEKALISEGILYVSFKYGMGELIRNGRYFIDMTEEKLKTFFFIEELFMILEQWKTTDVRPNREDEEWLNVILQKKK